ncbi:ABC transporter permease [Acetobacter sp. AN02]|uniref:MlaE family ABC transporter permease n=1 Tax=Acetobacter sp. AN02 TaxID=2894186 RepID=UPI0024342EA3|nr:ABC transporter permease [Acetobacter sp. AN02]MDG6094662.1 ABC transporter permease [Acetobacter sp. AN02]
MSTGEQPPSGSRDEADSDDRELLHAAEEKEHGDTPGGRFARFLGRIGHQVRHHLWFFLVTLGAGWGVVSESLRRTSWRRTVLFEFGSTLREVTMGGLFSTLVSGMLAGVSVVSQMIYWLGFAGMDEKTGSLLVMIDVREVAPILVGILMLGRSGMLTFTELGLLTTSGQTRALIADGVDPLLQIVMPRTLAYMIAGLTLGIQFSLASLVTGYAVSRASGAVSNPIWTFLYDVITAMTPHDYLFIPLKFIVVGFLVGLGCCIGGLTASSSDTISTMMPRGFSRGMLIVMAVSVIFSLNL